MYSQIAAGEERNDPREGLMPIWKTDANGLE